MVHLLRRRTVQYGAPQRHLFAKCPVSVLLLSTPALYTPYTPPSGTWTQPALLGPHFYISTALRH